MNGQARTQILACAGTLYRLPEGAEARAELEAWLFSAPHAPLWERWLKAFHADLYESRKGYPLNRVHHLPELEATLDELLAKAPQPLPRKRSQPTLCLSHDIDYLRSTMQMRLKRFVGYRRVMWRTADYLQSIRTMLEREFQIVGHKGSTTVFVACPTRVKHPKKRLVQWLIDPSYQLSQKEFARLLELLNEFECEIGLHGSFFSLAEDLLAGERSHLAQGTRHTVQAGRQHWLNLSCANPFERIGNSGIRFDSTLGWNGEYGFRGGFARPFPIVLENGKQLWELPLVLMDGPLFEDLKLSAEQVFERSTQLLEAVFQRRGCVSINWHDRAAHPDYGWFETYERILVWAKHRGFEFRTVSAAFAENTEEEHVC